MYKQSYLETIVRHNNMPGEPYNSPVNVIVNHNTAKQFNNSLDKLYYNLDWNTNSFETFYHLKLFSFRKIPFFPSSTAFSVPSK